MADRKKLLGDSGIATRIPRRRKVIYSTVICLSAGVALFATAEIYIRCASTIDDAGWYELTDDPILFYRLTPSKEGEDLGLRRTHTSQRIRGPWTFGENPLPGAHRVLWLGDSACFGTGCDDTQTAPFQFYEIAAASGILVESINLAVVGYNVRQVREVLMQRSAEFQAAESVIYYHHENDIVNAPWAALAPRLPGALYWEYEPPQNLAKKLIKRSAVVRRLWNTELVSGLFRRNPVEFQVPAIRKLSWESLSSLPPQHFALKCLTLYDEENEYGRRFNEELYLMADKVTSMGARFIMVYWPSVTVRHHEEVNRLRRMLSNWCVAKGILFVDATEEFLSSRDDDLYCDIIHPGPAGQRIIADAVYRAWAQEFLATP